MLVVVYLNRGSPSQVDGFGTDAERSVKGALHLRPNSLATITRDEWDHIQQEYPFLAPRLRLVREVAVETVSKEAEKPLEASTPSSTEVAAEGASGSEGERKEPPWEPGTGARRRGKKKRGDSD